MSNITNETPMRIPLSTMDEAMMHGGTLRHHSNVHVEVRAPGKLDAVRMRKAVYKAMKDHPLSRARQVEYKAAEKVFNWEITPEASVDPFLVVEAGSDGVATQRREQLLNMQPSLHESPPFYLWLVRRNKGDSLIFNFNHTAVDGIGAFHFLRSVVNNYAGVKDTTAIDPVAAREVSVTAKPNRKEKEKQRKAQMELMQRILSKAATIAPDGNSDRAGYGCNQLIILPREFKRLSPDKHVNATFNDLLLAAMHKSVELWNKEHDSDTALVRIQTPVNLRPAEWQYEVLGNYLGAFPTNSLPEERKDAANLMDAMVEQSRFAKETGFAAVMYEAMQLQSKVPIFLKEKLMPTLLTSSSTTACVSNLGRAPSKLVFGPDAPATEVWVSPPATMPMGVGLGALGYNGSLFLAFRYAHDLFDNKAAKRFADIYRDTLHWLS